MTVPELLDPKLDLVFKMRFGKPSNDELLLSRLNATLDEAAVSVEVLNPELTKRDIDDKGIVLVRLADGRQVDRNANPGPHGST